MILLLVAALTATPPRPPAPTTHAATARTSCTDPLAYQVRLDRIGFSPGEIDGTRGPDFTHALAAFQEQRKLGGAGNLNCPTLRALEDQAGPSLLTDYTITERDASGPFLGRQIPADLAEQATLPNLSYVSLIEAIAERYHMSPRLLARLNPGVHMAAGSKIRVPDVTPFDSTARPKAGPPVQVTVHVSRSLSALRAVRPDGTMVMFAPVTSGSEHDPLPLGHWRVTGIAWMPQFHDNPQLFWDADHADPKATIPAGPNNPVGVVWIDINVPHYGLHGTPSPDAIGHAQSHGCVRLTNWDAARLASIVRAGTPVIFEP